MSGLCPWQLGGVPAFPGRTGAGFETFVDLACHAAAKK